MAGLMMLAVLALLHNWIGEGSTYLLLEAPCLVWGSACGFSLRRFSLGAHLVSVLGVILFVVTPSFTRICHTKEKNVRKLTHHNVCVCRPTQLTSNNREIDITKKSKTNACSVCNILIQISLNWTPHNSSVDRLRSCRTQGCSYSTWICNIRSSNGSYTVVLQILMFRPFLGGFVISLTKFEQNGVF